MPVFKGNKAKKKSKPSKYPERVLKALVKEYDSNQNVRSNGMPESMLAIKAGIVDDYTKQIASNKWTYGDFVSEMNEVLRILIEQQYITIAGHDNSTRLLKPTMKGIDHARRLMRPWYLRIWDYFKDDVRTIIISVVTALLTTILVYWLSRLLGWL